MISRRTFFIHLVVLALLVACSFFNAMHSSFKMDDHDFFKDPKIINSKYFKFNWIPEPNRYLKLSVASEESSYRPVTNSLLSLLYHRFGYQAEPYHGMSIFLFFLGCALLYIFVVLLSGNGVLALLTASLFAVHPVNGLALNYVVASAYTYQLISTMLCMILFVLSFKWRNQWVPLAGGLFFFLVSLGVHETSLVLPVYLLGIAWLLSPGNIRTVCYKTLPFFLMLTAFLVLRMKYASLKTGVLEKFTDFHMSIAQFLATFVKLMAWYFSQLILPDGVVLMWSSKIVDNHVWAWLAAGLLLIGIAVWVVKMCGRSIQTWAYLSFLAGFVPVLGACLFRPTTGLVMEPHWMFFPAVGFFILYATALLRIFEWKKWVGVLLIMFLLSGLMKLSHLYNDLWSDEKTYCYYWLEKVPAFKTTEFFLAYAYMQEKNYDRARFFLLQAREGIFSDWQIYGNLGVMDYEDGNFDRAMEHYRTALKFNPDSGEIYNNLAVVLEKTGKIQEAVAANEKALQLNRFMVEPRLNLARISLAKNDVPAAVSFYKENLEVVPYEHRSVHLLFKVLIDARMFPDAQALIQDLIAHGDSAVLMTGLAVVAAEKQQPLWALDLYMQALRIKPDHKETYVQAGVLLANLNYLDRAIQMWEQALSLGADDPEVLHLIKKAKAGRNNKSGS